MAMLSIIFLSLQAEWVTISTLLEIEDKGSNLLI